MYSTLILLSLSLQEEILAPYGKLMELKLCSMNSKLLALSILYVGLNALQNLSSQLLHVTAQTLVMSFSVALSSLQQKQCC